KRAHPFLANVIVEIADREAEQARDLEEPTSRHTVYSALVLVQLLISYAEKFGKLRLGQPQHDPPLTDTGADMIIDRRGDRPLLGFFLGFSIRNLEQVDRDELWGGCIALVVGRTLPFGRRELTYPAPPLSGVPVTGRLVPKTPVSWPSGIQR